MLAAQLAAWLVPAGLSGRARGMKYHSIRNAAHRGELVRVCNEMGLTGFGVEVGVWHGGFSRHNLKTWNGTRYYMVDAWSFRANDTLKGKNLDGTVSQWRSTDKNSKRDAEHDHDYKMAARAVEPWLAPHSRPRAVMMRRFAEAARLSSQTDISTLFTSTPGTSTTMCSAT